MAKYIKIFVVTLFVVAYAWVSNDDFDTYQVAHSGGVYASAK